MTHRLCIIKQKYGILGLFSYSSYLMVFYLQPTFHWWIRLLVEVADVFMKDWYQIGSL